MKKFFIAAILLIIPHALAQTPAETSERVFDAVIGNPLPDCYDAANVVGEDLANFDYAYCAVINDTLTLANQTLTEMAFADDGYIQFQDQWEYSRLGIDRLRSYLQGFYNGDYYAVATLSIIRYNYQEFTVILLFYNEAY